MRNRTIGRLWPLISLLNIAAALVSRGEGTNNVAPRADQILRDATRYLADSPQFTVSAEVWRERVTESGQKLQFTRQLEMEVRRPDRLHAHIRSPLSERDFYYDGKSLSILDRKQNVFSSAPMPSNLDGALDTAQDQFGIDLPLIDLAVSDPYRNATARIETGRYFGRAPVLGVECHHLAFTQDNIDWQVWIESGPRPLIRKFVITHKLEDGAPQLTALLTHWNLADRIADSDFAFVPPPGASHVEMRPANARAPAQTAARPDATSAPENK